MRVAVTGGLGFIGSAVVRHLIGHTEHEVLNLDIATYAATTGSTATVADDPRYRHLAVDVTDGPALRRAFADFAPDAVCHLAAETHVDRSIDGPAAFVHTNIVGTYELLRAAAERSAGTRFLHVSTDEVFGSLGPTDPAFDEHTPYDPRSPYSASKAGADHLVRAWHHTYGLAAIVTNCSNNYGPYHFPEKLIPLMIVKAAAGEPLPVYGRGDNVRDWLHVDDHARGIVAALERGRAGATYTFGGSTPELGAERTNLQVVHAICDQLDRRLGLLDGDRPRRSLVGFVDDRPGHDRRYAVDSSTARRDLGWTPSVGFDDGLAATIDWYLANETWWRPLLADRYDGRRLGVTPTRAGVQP